nr:LytTR family DNA-binding domain-containing protein [uncultured Acetatifactor sp.]
MLHLAICDDDKRFLDYLSGEIESWAVQGGHSGADGETCSVERYPCADAFLFAWEERKDTDILLLDIEMPGTDGMALARKLRQMGDYVSIIFVTGNPDFALEGYDLEAVSYIVKPVKRQRLWAALDRARERIAHRAAIIVALFGGEVEKVYLSDICCLEGDGHDCILWKRDGEKLICRSGILQMEQKLMEDMSLRDSFFKPHRSYCVNLEHVERIGKKEIRMDNRMTIPIARGKWEELNRVYMAYFRRQSF